MANRTQPRPWTPMQRATPVPLRQEQIDALKERGAEALVDELSAAEVWKNDRYTVIVRRSDEGDVISLSIRRNDRKPLRDWRMTQRIKNEIAGEEVEACELYPAMSRLVDTANQTFLWCAPPGKVFPFGFTQGVLADDGDTPGIGHKQRALPEDWKRSAS